jgi:mono/diheme cytochrome c family protein
MSRALLCFAFVAWGLLVSFASAADSGKLQYNRDIRPILVDHCFACHGADSAARKADLRLDQREAAIDSGVIKPGSPSESSLIDRIMATDPDEVMPPPATKKTLKPEQKELLKRWISEGAEYEPHWSFIELERPAIPEVKNKAWVRNPIDAFILAKLESLGLEPAPEADRRTLARRLSLDITGLPPEPAVVDAFVNDQSPNAYEKLVDKLMESPQWGEHRGRYWLDVARYADTHGIHFDNFREIWPYRDWVIRAFNENKRFDEFTIEQLAGDLLPNRTFDQLGASGFNRCNITTNEGGAIAEEYLVLYNRERTETFAQTWLGMTANCAVCHDHKFDPLSQKEFYELAAFFNNTTQGAMDGNIPHTPPVMQVPRREDEPRYYALDGEIASAEAAQQARKEQARGEFEQWLATAKGETDAVATIPTDKLYFYAPLSEGQGRTTKIQVGGQERDVELTEKASWQPGNSGPALQSTGAALELYDVANFERNQPFSTTAWVKLYPNDSSGAIVARMDNGSKYRGWDLWVQARRVGTHIINAWPDNALKVVADAQVPGNTWTHVVVTYDGSSKASGVKIYYNGEEQKTKVEADKLSATVRTRVPFKLGQRNTADILAGVTVQDLRIYQRVLTAAEVESLAKTTRLASLLAKPHDQRTPAEKDELYRWWLGTSDKTYQELTANLNRLQQEKANILARGAKAYVMQEKNTPAMAFVLYRGEYDQRREKVSPNTPSILPKMDPNEPRNRLGLARWLLRKENPLTARVTVNRFWQEVFGTGIVKTSGDLGTAGELPVNQPLLDWLAVDFREGGWDVKRFFKQIFMSSTYRQAAITTPEKREKDRENRFLSRGPRFRMDAEMIRDYALASSGILVQKLGGPSVKPYQPDGVWEAVAMIGSNTRNYKRDTGENLYRRSMYTFWKRSAPPASMEIFNAPNRESCVSRRERTNTPLQALVTLNDPQFVEAARFLAQRAMKEGGEGDDARLDFIAQRVLCRPLRANETPIVLESLKEMREYYAAHADDAQKLITVGESKPDPALTASELAAWTMIANELLNMDEVLNK